jgi:EmrB/QacA subfamily drug resistance transporter
MTDETMRRRRDATPPVTLVPGQAARPYVALSVVCFGLVIVVLDNSILNIAVPALARDLHASTSELQWIVDAYTLIYACTMLTAGSLGDRFGRRRSLVWGVSCFGAASALASLATSSVLLVLCRGLMGLCAAFITPASLSVVTNLFHDSRERSRAIGIWASVSSAGAAAGPVLGGLLLARFWWGSVFLVNVPIAIALALALPRFVPESSDPSPAPLDPIGAVLSILAMSVLLWSTIAGPDKGWTSPWILGGYAAAVSFVVAFVWWESHCANPMLDLGFFRIPAFSAAAAGAGAMVCAWAGTAFVFVQLLQSVLGFSALKAGLALLPFAVMAVLGGLLSTPLAAIVGRKWAICLGLGCEALGSALFLTYRLSGGYPMAIAFYLVFSAGQTVVFSQTVAAAMDCIPREKAGVASGANNTLRQAALAFGVAISGSLLSSTYRSQLADRTAGLGFDAATVEKAGRSIGSAVQEAKTLPGSRGADLLVVARESFIPGLHAAMLVALIACLLGIAATIIWMPGTPRR